MQFDEDEDQDEDDDDVSIFNLNLVPIPRGVVIIPDSISSVAYYSKIVYRRLFHYLAIKVIGGGGGDALPDIVGGELYRQFRRPIDFLVVMFLW